MSCEEGTDSSFRHYESGYCGRACLASHSKTLGGKSIYSWKNWRSTLNSEGKFDINRSISLCSMSYSAVNIKIPDRFTFIEKLNLDSVEGINLGSNWLAISYIPTHIKGGFFVWCNEYSRWPLSLAIVSIWIFLKQHFLSRISLHSWTFCFRFIYSIQNN